jgi:hypothetical protein
MELPHGCLRSGDRSIAGAAPMLLSRYNSVAMKDEREKMLAGEL